MQIEHWDAQQDGELSEPALRKNWSDAATQFPSTTTRRVLSLRITITVWTKLTPYYRGGFA